ncbi:MAG: dTDP-4-dehydrorhamnose reductase [Bacteroidales bacterium]|nr:dTDP-4-dehydrorhamnose reductase [Bacteroidales bacterium]
MNVEKILVLGADGQLGSKLKQLHSFFSPHVFFFRDLPELDITQKSNLISEVERLSPSIIINAAAYTNVDQAEIEKEKAFLVNAYAVENISKICEEHHIFLIHISTDYVFDGKKSTPYDETDPVNPKSVYGQSKLEGELLMKKILSRGVIIRTSWLYNETGHNFVRTILKLSQEKSFLQVVYDQIGTPTWAEDLARICLHVAFHKEKIQSVEIFHYSNEGVASWYDFAQEILFQKQINIPIIPIRTSQMPRPAPRPSFSVLSKEKLKAFFNIVIPYWKDSLSLCLKNMNEPYGKLSG